MCATVTGDGPLHWEPLNGDLAYATFAGGPTSAHWQVIWYLTLPTANGGWIVQKIDATLKSGRSITYWEAWQVPVESQATTWMMSMANNFDDMFAGFAHVDATASYYDGLVLPDAFVAGTVSNAGTLRSTTSDPHLPIVNASAAVLRSWPSSWWPF